MPIHRGIPSWDDCAFCQEGAAEMLIACPTTDAGTPLLHYRLMLGSEGHSYCPFHLMRTRHVRPRTTCRRCDLSFAGLTLQQRTLHIALCEDLHG